MFNTQHLLKKSLIAGALGLLILVSASLTYFYHNFNRVFVSTSSAQPPNLDSTPTPTPDPLAPFGVAVLGFGGPNHDGGYLTDTLIVAYIQPRNQAITLISIPRDLWVEIPTKADSTQPFKINAAYAIGRDDKRYPHKPSMYTGEGGGGALAKKVLGEVTGLEIKYFVSLSFQGFVKSIDVLDGVKVKVPYTFDDFHYPIAGKEDDTCGKSTEDIAALTATVSGQKLELAFECRYEHLHFEAGTQMLDGETALKYVRSRHSPTAGGDYARAERQRSLIVGVRDRVFALGFLPKMIPFISKLTSDMQTDIDLATIQDWITKADEYRGYTITSIALTEENVLQHTKSTDGQFILVSKSGLNNWQSIHEFLQMELDKTASASAQNEP